MYINETRKGHGAILQAIESGNENEAERLVREHIRIARRHFERKSSENASFMPEWLLPLQSSDQPKDSSDKTTPLFREAIQ